MAGRAVETAPSLITDARYGASLSTDQRTKRYLWTMLVRVVCFIAGVASPTPLNVVWFLGAALLPGVAVLLGNARDNRPEPVVADDEHERLALTTGGEVVPGFVEEGDSR